MGSNEEGVSDEKATAAVTDEMMTKLWQGSFGFCQIISSIHLGLIELDALSRRNLDPEQEVVISEIQQELRVLLKILNRFERADGVTRKFLFSRLVMVWREIEKQIAIMSQKAVRND